MNNTRKSFLARLKFYMLWSFGVAELRDTAADFDGFFTSGLAEGKTESQLCKEFGEPRDIVKTMLLEKGATQAQPGFFIKMLLLLLLAVLGVMVIAFKGGGAISSLISAVFALVLAAIIWCIAGGVSVTGSFLPTRKDAIIFCVIEALVLAAGIAQQKFCWRGGLFFKEHTPAVLDPFYIRLFCGCYVVLIVLCIVYTAYKTRRGKQYMFCIVMQLAGLLCATLQYIAMLCNVKNFNSLSNFVLVPFWVCTALAAVYPFAGKTKKGR